MLILSLSQSKNYFKKLQSSSHSEGCGCCHSTTNYRVDGNKILQEHYGENQGYIFFNVTVIAKIKGVRSN